MEAQIRLLCGAGFAPHEALSILIALSRFVVGWVLEEQAEAEHAGECGAAGPSPSPIEHPLLAGLDCSGFGRNVESTN